MLLAESNHTQLRSIFFHVRKIQNQLNNEAEKRSFWINLPQKCNWARWKNTSTDSPIKKKKRRKREKENSDIGLRKDQCRPPTYRIERSGDRTKSNSNRSILFGNWIRSNSHKNFVNRTKSNVRLSNGRQSNTIKPSFIEWSANEGSSNSEP